jgi:hypothetical protein
MQSPRGWRSQRLRASKARVSIALGAPALVDGAEPIVAPIVSPLARVAWMCGRKQGQAMNLPRYFCPTPHRPARSFILVTLVMIGSMFSVMPSNVAMFG